MALDAKELRDKTPDQLREQLADLKKESFNLLDAIARRWRSLTRDTARVKTILNEKARAAAAPEA